MRAATSIRKFVGRWVTVVLKNGMKMTMKVKNVAESLYGLAVVQYEIAGSRELRQIPRSEIIEIYA